MNRIVGYAWLTSFALALLVVAPGNARSYTGSTPVTQDQEQTAYTLVKISLADAMKTALDACPGKAVTAGISVENGYLVYGVEVVGTGGAVTDVKIDAGTGKVLARDVSKDESNDSVDNQTGDADSTTVKGSTPAPSEQSGLAALSGLAKVSLTDAIGSAQAAFPGTVLDAGLENENGSVVYGVEVISGSGTRTDVKVDAGNGKVLRHETKTGENEHKDQEQKQEQEQENDGE
jgi:uncharacterized membrane protein YkoI